MWLPVVALALSATLAELPLAGRNASSSVARRRAQSRHRVPMNGACAVRPRERRSEEAEGEQEGDSEEVTCGGGRERGRVGRALPYEDRDRNCTLIEL